MLIQSLPGEEWRYIPTYEGLYQISTLGRIYSEGQAGKRAQLIKPDSHSNVRLSKNKQSKSWQVHTLMGCTFLELDINDPYRNRVLLIDGDISNPVLTNLYIEDTSDLPGEIWRPISKANNRKVQLFYQVSNLGRMKTVKHEVAWNNHGKLSTKCVPEMILGLTTDIDGYKTVWMSDENHKDLVAQVHRLVAAAFCVNDDPEHKTQVNHIDGDPSNNHYTNLEWCTPAENSQHAVRTGLRKNPHKVLRYPVKRLETGEMYESISEVDRATGRASGYWSERIHRGSYSGTAANGDVWTIEVMKDVYQYIPGEGTHCYFEEYPDRKYISLGEASRDIGRWDGYVSECIKDDRKIISKITSEELHVVCDKKIAAKFNFNK